MKNLSKNMTVAAALAFAVSALCGSAMAQETAAVPAVAATEPAGADAVNVQEIKPASDGILPDGETQYQSIYNFYSETIKNTVGLRGYALQLKVERAGSIEDFRALRTPYLEAVFKAKGAEMARSLRDRLDQLLYLGETPPLHSNTPGPNF